MDINVSLVRRLIATQFPRWAHLPVKPVEFSGWDNRTFRLGDDMTARLPSAQAYEAQVKKEQRWLPKLVPPLPLAIPNPLEMGMPSEEYPLHWSVYRWIDGENATFNSVRNMTECATQLSGFINALQQIDSSGGPPPGPHNFYRGASLSVYDEETRNAISALGNDIDTEVALAIWEDALESTWHGAPVWIHGDVHATNLLVKEGKLSAVIDFGCSGVGDPACDLTIAWTFFAGPSREAFLSNLHVDHDTVQRARGWALWKALITLAASTDNRSPQVEEGRRVISDLTDDYRQR